jgi:hypothetical protein
VKAFDTVPQDALFAVLRRYGLTNPFCDIIIRHYKNATTKLKIGSIDSEIESSIGVRQFFVLVMMQAALETMKWPVPKPEFCTRKNGVTMGERTDWKRGITKHEHS